MASRYKYVQQAWYRLRTMLCSLHGTTYVPCNTTSTRRVLRTRRHAAYQLVHAHRCLTVQGIQHVQVPSLGPKGTTSRRLSVHSAVAPQPDKPGNLDLLGLLGTCYIINTSELLLRTGSTYVHVGPPSTISRLFFYGSSDRVSGAQAPQHAVHPASTLPSPRRAVRRR